MKNLLGQIKYLLGSSVIAKVLGVLRVLIIAYIFGSKKEYADFLIISSFVDFFSAFAGQAALQGNLVPKLTKALRDNYTVSFKEMKKDALNISYFIFIFNMLFTLIYSYILWEEITVNTAILCIILSLTMSMFIFNNIGLMITQAKGEYKAYSNSIILNSSTNCFTIYPLGYFGSVTGLAFSRLLSVFVLYFGGWKLADNKKIETNSHPYEIRLNYKDFNLYTLIIGNTFVFLLLLGKVLYGISGSQEITYFLYSTTILGAIITTLVKAFSTVMLRENSLTINIKGVIINLTYISIACLSFFSVIYFYGDFIIENLFQRGHFNQQDTFKTYTLMKQLIIPFFVISCFEIIIQPLLSLNNQLTALFTKVCVIFIIVCSVIFISIELSVSTGTEFNIIRMFYTISIGLMAIGIIFISNLSRLTKRINKKGITTEGIVYYENKF
ncbi:hypothetical protein V6R21_29015 [Limibacter armeniacum]|uniref:hypothetical protein n=1 Tax=Limibacter armeniacum TaxID=466084 RepID=UPI002FE64461